MIKECDTCKKEFKTDRRTSKFCCRDCYYVANVNSKNLTHRFPKGHKIGIGNKYALGLIPWNKGIKAQTNTGKTHFKKGFTPWNKGIKGLYKRTEETKLKMSLAQKGEKGSNWQGGKSFEIYPQEFSKELKEQIRERDNHICQECKYSEEKLGYKLHIHHIDYNKKNNKLDNLISLCRSCHQKTNFNRDNWINYYKNKLGIANSAYRIAVW